MFGSTALEVAIGLIFIYLLLSLLCSAINEWIAGILALRAKNLAAGIKSLLQDNTGTGLAKALYSHALIDSLSKKSQPSKDDQPLVGKDGPSYIPPRAFANALMDHLGLLLPPDPQAASEERVKKQVEILDKANLDPKVKEGIKTLIIQANGDIAKLQQNVEVWFDDAMDRVSGWYKRQTQVILLVLGLLITLCMDADTIRIAETLSRTPTMRASIIAEAQQFSGQNLPPPVAKDILDKLNKVPFPLGWQPDDPNDTLKGRSNPLEAVVNYTWMPIVGWLLTAAALSLGAPFWFDLLNKIMHIRSTGNTPAEKGKEPQGKP